MPLGMQIQVMHGCFQLMQLGVWLSPTTSATLVFSCHCQVWIHEQTASNEIDENEDDIMPLVFFIVLHGGRGKFYGSYKFLGFRPLVNW